MHLVLVDVHGDHAGVGQQRVRELQPRVHHVQPVGMEPAVRLGVGAALHAAFGLAGDGQVVAQAVAEVVRIDEIAAGVVRRIDVDQLDLARVALVQQLHHVEVVALDHEVAGVVPRDAIGRAGPQRAGGRRERGLPRAALAVPVEAVFFVGVADRAIADQRLQRVDVDRRAVRAFGHEFGEQRLQARDVVGGEIRRHRLRARRIEFLHRHFHPGPGRAAPGRRALSRCRRPGEGPPRANPKR